MYVYHSFLIHSSADGHLGCFHVLAIINSAATNIGVHVSLSDLVSSVCMPRSGIAGSYGSFLSSFLRNIHPVLIVAVLVCIPTNSVKGFPFFHTQRSFLYSCSLYSCHLFLISSASVRSIPFLSFIEPILHEIFAWWCPLILQKLIQDPLFPFSLLLSNSSKGN